MMKELNFGSLLLLLLCALTPRNNSANPFPSDVGMMDGEQAKVSGLEGLDTMEGTHSHIWSPIVDGTPGTSHVNISINISINIPVSIMKGVEIFKNTVVVLQEKVDNSQFVEAIFKFEKDISSLPEDLAPKRADILLGLYSARDRILLRRNKLELAANQLIKNCDEMIAIYDTDDHSLDLINYGAKQFVDAACLVRFKLQEALNLSNDLNDELSEAQAFLVDYTAKLNETEANIKLNETTFRAIQIKNLELENQLQEIDKNPEVDRKHYNRFKVHLCIEFLLQCGYGCIPITFTKDPAYSQIIHKAEAETKTLQELNAKLQKQQTDIEAGNQLLEKIRPAQESGSTIIYHVVDIKIFLLNDIKLIEEWEISLSASIKDHKGGIDKDDIKYNIDRIIDRLIDLRKACVHYVNHKVLDILESLGHQHPS